MTCTHEADSGEDEECVGDAQKVTETGHHLDRSRREDQRKYIAVKAPDLPF